MKAYEVYDKDYCCPTIVFARTSWTAKILALHTKVCEDSSFARIKAIRVPQADCFYQKGQSEINWYNDDQRVFLVKEMNWGCEKRSDECKGCPAREYCFWMTDENKLPRKRIKVKENV